MSEHGWLAVMVIGVVFSISSCHVSRGKNVNERLKISLEMKKLELNKNNHKTIDKLK